MADRGSSLAYPENVCFSCTECGDCCRSWNVPLGSGELERLSTLDWTDRASDLVGVSPTSDAGLGADAPAPRLARRSDGACVYLGAENQCRLHEHFGKEAKPLMCRLYPFSFYPMSAQTAVDVSF